jgi:hypothetical protein
MAYYRRRIETVEAVQFVEGEPWPPEVRAWSKNADATYDSVGYVLASPSSTASLLPIHYGDYILRDQDVRRVMRPSIFNKTYEIQVEYI